VRRPSVLASVCSCSNDTPCAPSQRASRPPACRLIWHVRQRFVQLQIESDDNLIATCLFSFASGTQI